LGSREQIFLDRVSLGGLDFTGAARKITRSGRESRRSGQDRKEMDYFPSGTCTKYDFLRASWTSYREESPIQNRALFLESCRGCICLRTAKGGLG